jgi:hypothetical protein
MDPAIENSDLDPPPSPSVVWKGLPVAIVAHVLLVMALASGVQWKRQPDPAMAAIPLPPVTAAAPSTATMGAAPAPSEAPATQAVARQTAPPAQRSEPAERVAPSFDCARARSTSEKIICADPELSRLDRDLGRLHARARDAAPDPAAFKRQSDAQWFQRERSCRDRDCLLRWYAMRREQLTAFVAENENPARR